MARYGKDWLDDSATKSAGKNASKMSDAVDKAFKKQMKAAEMAEKAAVKAAAAQEKAAARVVAAQEKAIKALERVQSAEQKKAAASQKSAAADAKRMQATAARNDEARAAEMASSAADNAAASAEAEAAALGAVEAVALAAAAAVAALVVVTLKLAASAIEIVQQRAGLLSTLAALAGGEKAGRATLAIVDKMAEKLPFLREQIDAWAIGLEKAGFRGQALGKAMQAVGAAEAILKGGGAAAQNLFTKLAAGGKETDKFVKQIREGGPKANKLLRDIGLSVNDIGTAAQRAKMSNDEMGKAIEAALMKRGAGRLAQLGATFEVIFGKLKEGLGSLFEGLDGPVGGFMNAVKNLFGQFNRGTPIMKALKPIVTEVFGALFHYATMAVKAISRFVQQNVNAKTIGKTWDGIKSAIVKVASALSMVWSILGPILTSSFFLNGMATMFKIVAVAIVVVVGVLGAMTATIGALSAAVVAVGSFLWGLIGQVASLGASIIEGILNFDPGAFVLKMANMASQGLAAFKKVLGIASPSRVMMQMGGYIAEGAAQGTDRGAPKAVGAAARLGSGIASGAAAGGSGKGGGRSITIESGAIVIHAGGATITEEALASILERLLMSQGLA